ncbi:MULTISPECIES: hypothetical protein [Pseudomonas]|uniref:hypothetical protein n=1 Tax=Pseudomonas TaxID=286 RepID=UPI000A4F7614|nr:MULTISPECIES: hypothetical protein [Pseudomonas]
MSRDLSRSGSDTGKFGVSDNRISRIYDDCVADRGTSRAPTEDRVKTKIAVFSFTNFEKEEPACAH